MREFIPHVITPEEAKTLVSSIKTKDNSKNSPIVDKIKGAIELTQADIQELEQSEKTSPKEEKKK